MKKTEFLAIVEGYVREHPDVGAYVSDAVSNGLSSALHEARERASDMEVALSVSMDKKWRDRDSLILSKLKKWVSKSSIPWESTIEMLEEKNEGV